MPDSMLLLPCCYCRVPGAVGGGGLSLRKVWAFIGRSGLEAVVGSRLGDSVYMYCMCVYERSLGIRKKKGNMPK